MNILVRFTHGTSWTISVLRRGETFLGFGGCANVEVDKPFEVFIRTANRGGMEDESFTIGHPKLWRKAWILGVALLGGSATLAKSENGG